MILISFRCCGTYRVKYLLVTMSGGGQEQNLADAKLNQELRFVQCFAPTSQAVLYDNQICVLEVLPAPTPSLNLLFREGWSGLEEWGRWIDGTEAKASWIATGKAPHYLHVQAFPYCVSGQQQQVSIEVKGTPVAEHQWTDCEPWSASIPIPAGLFEIGPNDVVHPDWLCGAANRQLRCGNRRSPKPFGRIHGIARG